MTETKSDSKREPSKWTPEQVLVPGTEKFLAKDDSLVSCARELWC